jgi:urease accessory protein
MHALTLLGTLILAGPLLAPLSAFFLAEFAAQPRIGARDFRSAAAQLEDAETAVSDEEAWRKERWRQEREDGVVWSAARVRGCTVVKFGAETVEGGRRWVGGMIAREGSVVEVFGEEAVMCLR